MILAIFSFVGNMPVDRDWLMTVFSGNKIWVFIFFIKVEFNLSRPQLGLSDKEFIIFRISFWLDSEKEKVCSLLFCKKD